MALQVYKLAEELGVDAKALSEFLGKGSHLNAVSAEEEKLARQHYSDVVSKKSKLVRFISLKRRHKIETPDGIIEFLKFKFTTYEGTKAHEYLLEAGKHNPDIMVLTDKPFETDKDRTTWRKMINDQVKSADDEVMPDYGLDFLAALFNKDEAEKYAEMLTRSVDEAIEYVVRTKSYTSTREIK